MGRGVEVTIYVRFTETERFDPMKGCEVVRFMATTDKGSYHTEIPLDGPQSLRTNKAAFKAKVVECIQTGKSPCEVVL